MNNSMNVLEVGCIFIGGLVVGTILMQIFLRTEHWHNSMRWLTMLAIGSGYVILVVLLAWLAHSKN